MPNFETNIRIAEIFSEMADILDIQEVAWKPRAYRMAERAIRDLSFDLKTLYKKGGIKALEEIPGVGEGLAKKIIEYIETGKMKEYNKLTKTIPPGLKRIIEIPGMGPKKSYVLFKKLKIKTINDLKKAVNQHKIRNLKGFGIISEEDIGKNLGLKKTHTKRIPINRVIRVANKIVSELKKLKETDQISIGGSLRRKEPTIGDIDILATSNKPEPIMNKFTKLSFAKKIIAKGSTKSVVILNNGMQADIRVVRRESYGAALQYFTGNKQHNIELRRIAKKLGYKLSEYGLFDKNNKMVAGSTEEGIYKKLGLRYIPPEKRHNEGEFEVYKL